MDKSSIFIGVAYNIKKVEVVVMDGLNRVLLQDNCEFELTPGMDNLINQTADYFYKLPQEIRKAIPLTNNPFYSFRVCTNASNLFFSGLERKKIDVVSKSIMFTYYQILGITRWCFLKNGIEISYYPDTLLNLFFARTKNHSPAAIKLALYHQWRRGFRNPNTRLAFCLCLMEKLKLSIINGRACQGYTEEQKNLMKLFLDKPEQPELYETLFED